ncbi:hypothetical protein JW979_14525 [bacterium]|nr:hypothetical protein [candidate division CSSED10-310 bacterium]
MPFFSVACFLVLLTIAGTVRCQQNDSMRQLNSNLGHPGSKLVDLTLQKPDGKKVKLQDFSEQFLLLLLTDLDIIAGRAQMILCERLRKEYSKSFLNITAVAIQKRSRQKVSLYLSNRPLDFEILSAEPSVEMAFGGVWIIPTILIVNQDKVIVERFDGYRSYDILKEKLEHLRCAPKFILKGDKE